MKARGRRIGEARPLGWTDAGGIGALLMVAHLTGCAGGAAPPPTPAAGPAIFQPGAPGQDTRTVSAQELAATAGPGYTDADVRFMQGMIPHHAQALEMTALVRQHATTDAVRQMALRMEISQRDEIALMESWLRSRGEPVAMSGGHMGHMGNTGDDGGDGPGSGLMPGMLTPDQMEELRNARGVEFDRLFLRYMIQHHQGAIDMVSRLFMASGAAQESTIFKFAEDVEVDQAMEIARMQTVLDGLEGRD